MAARKNQAGWVERLQDTQLSLPIEDAGAEWFQLLARRNAALESLLQSLKHLDREHCFIILTSSLTIEQLEDLARFQASKDKI